MEENLLIKNGLSISPAELKKRLGAFGYERVDKALEPGTFSILGGNITIYLVNLEMPILLEYFGDEIEKITDLSANQPLSETIIGNNTVRLEDGSIIKSGDYIVHIDHGIGIYRRRGFKDIGNKSIEYIYLEYFNQDYLYLPLSLKEKISKYIGVGRKPKINKLGTQTWVRTRKKAFENALRLAKELLQIYAKRELTKREPYRIDAVWDKEVISSFGYSETEDQISAINDVYSDLKSDLPMDRLVSGDVGYGKTEIAIRAIAQCVANHKQAALICPTTILAQQHFANITSRLSKLPVKTAMLSRFVAKEEQENIIREVNRGNIDVVIGTHRLLSEEVKFKNLDLVIIDEEQRFGVKQKEHFKKIRSNINIISLSATPIPRTLFMSLSGIRDISQIMTAPHGRRSIETEISEYNEGKIAEYLKREKERGGQIYYLYNRVETIQAVAARLQRIVPDIKIAIAHGQMPENTLANIMNSFVKDEYDILLCTTIIENGLDLPNVNTLIVEDADNYGLSQLYQIRGRIGRSEKQAYSLFMHKKGELPVNAFKRLKALADNSTLGSGFNISLSDLEIRGGGNILGREQHGNMEAVGLVLYGQLLSQAVRKLKEAKN